MWPHADMSYRVSQSNIIRGTKRKGVEGKEEGSTETENQEIGERTREREK